MWLIWVIFIKKDLGLIESVFASDLLFYLIVWGRKSLAACFCFCEVWHAINGVGGNRLVAALRNQVSCGLSFLHAYPSLLCSPTHSLWRLKPDLQASFSVLISCPLSRACQPWQTFSEGKLPGWGACTILLLVSSNSAWLHSPHYWGCRFYLNMGRLLSSRKQPAGSFLLLQVTVFSIASNSFFLRGGRGGGCSCPPHTLPAAIPTPRASPPFAVNTEWSLYRHFPTCWHLFTWVCANCTLSCSSRCIFRVFVLSSGIVTICLEDPMKNYRNEKRDATFV